MLINKVAWVCSCKVLYIIFASMQRIYIAIDLKSFFASVECVERGLDPLDANLVVADESRTDKTICLAVSPSLKSYGIGGRARLFEVRQRLRIVNEKRALEADNYKLKGKSKSDRELREHKDWEVDFYIAAPRMSYYIKYSTRVYEVYLRYIAPEDIHVYSIDEVFIDATSYLKHYKMTAHELAMKIIREVLAETGITATAGIGSNLYLCKIAMDIVAKHIPADADGVRIAELDEMEYRRQLWNHKPMTDFWRYGRGITEKLEMYGISTMGQLARFSLTHEDTLYKLFGVNAELIIDHAWGWEPCTIDYIKSYTPSSRSLSTGQVLSEPYTFEKARVVVHEMADNAALDLVSKRLVTNQLVLTVSYDVTSLETEGIRSYNGEIVSNHYGKLVPKHAHGTSNLGKHTSSSHTIINAILELYDRVVNPEFFVRRINISVNNVVREEVVNTSDKKPVQLDMFTDYEAEKQRRDAGKRAEAKERRMQEAVLGIKSRYGKNAILKGINFAEGATAKDRNKQIGGHRAE